MATSLPCPTPPRIVSRAAWLAARRELLAREKEHTRARERLTAERQNLPWVKVTEPYVFATPEGPRPLGALFGGHTQLIVYHFMFGPGWEEGCASCSFIMDHVDGMGPHLQARDTAFTAISRAPLPDLEHFKQRMGWKFPWVSSSGNSFNFDYHVSFTAEALATGDGSYNFGPIPAGQLPVEELPGVSVFFRHEDGTVFHTYSAYARGLEMLLGTYHWLDLTPKGRDEAALNFSMAWLRHHDRYDGRYAIDPERGYVPPKGSICRHCE
jgi:predicted dithiol-disulfide oxidoreductase (DUF899 family)